MKLIKILSLTLIISFLASVLFTPVQAQETPARQAGIAGGNTNDLANILVEFETDEITAKSFNIEEPTALPGQFKYNWQIFKENIGLFFTFNQEKKIRKLEDISHRRLLEAKKLSETDTANAANHVEDTLSRYNATRQKISDRLAANPELKEKLLETFDANQIKHQQIMATVVEKLRSRIPEEKLDKLENIKKEDALRWYNIDKKNIQTRLEKAIDNNNVGSKFKQLKNIATLEELSISLPIEAKDAVAAAKVRAEARLSKKLEKFDSQDKEKLEKYINNIKIPELIKQTFVSNLRDSAQLPTAVTKKAENILNSYSSALRNRFQNLDAEGKRKFLNQFEDKRVSHPVNIQFLESLDMPAEYRPRLQNLLETQIEGVKENIQQSASPVELRIWERNLQAYPVLIREIQEQQRLLPTVDPNYPTNPTGGTNAIPVSATPSGGSDTSPGSDTPTEGNDEPVYIR